MSTSVQGDKGFIIGKITISGTLPFATIDELTGFHRTTMDKRHKIDHHKIKI